MFAVWQRERHIKTIGNHHADIMELKQEGSLPSFAGQFVTFISRGGGRIPTEIVKVLNRKNTLGFRPFGYL